MISTSENYCCVIDKKLYFGNKKLAEDEEKLKKIGIKSIIDLIGYKNKNEEIKHSNYFNLLHLKIIDTPLNNADWAEKGAKFIDEEMKKNNPIYVHCEQGLSRSVTLIIYYLMTREKKTFKDSFFYLKKLRFVICPTTGFIKSLILLDNKLFGKNSFNFDDYCLFTLKESFPLINENDINELYEKNKKFYNENIDLYNKEANDKKCEPIGYKTIDDLLAKFGKEKMLLREGCSYHHPFD